jgi:hypothetical protein
VECILALEEVKCVVDMEGKEKNVRILLVTWNWVVNEVECELHKLISLQCKSFAVVLQ